MAAAAAAAAELTALPDTELPPCTTVKRVGDASGPVRVHVTCHAHAHLAWAPVVFDILLPASFPTNAPVVHVLSSPVGYASSPAAARASVDHAGRVRLALLAHSNEAAATGSLGWMRSHTLLDVVFFLRTTLARSTPLVRHVAVDGSEVPDGAPPPPPAACSGAGGGAGSGAGTTVAMPLSVDGSAPRTRRGSARGAPPPSVLVSGHHSLQGRRPTMEDAVLCCSDLGCATPLLPLAEGSTAALAAAAEELCGGSSSWSFAAFAVFDGHGGSRAADLAAARFADLCRVRVQRGGGCTASSDGSSPSTVGGRVAAALAGTFADIEAEFAAVGTPSPAPSSASTPGGLSLLLNSNFGDDQSGCTAVCAVLARCGAARLLTVGNAGDSRAVLARGGTAVALSVDHKTTRPDERARILGAGGMIIRNRVLGRLAVTRAIGDCALKRGAGDALLVSGEPELFSAWLVDADELLLLACDGLFDVCTSQEAVDAALSTLARGATLDEAAQALAQGAYDAGSADNITVLSAVSLL